MTQTNETNEWVPIKQEDLRSFFKEVTLQTVCDCGLVSYYKNKPSDLTCPNATDRNDPKHKVHAYAWVWRPDNG